MHKCKWICPSLCLSVCVPVSLTILSLYLLLSNRTRLSSSSAGTWCVAKDKKVLSRQARQSVWSRWGCKVLLSSYLCVMSMARLIVTVKVHARACLCVRVSMYICICICIRIWSVSVCVPSSCALTLFSSWMPLAALYLAWGFVGICFVCASYKWLEWCCLCLNVIVIVHRCLCVCLCVFECKAKVEICKEIVNIG